MSVGFQVFLYLQKKRKKGGERTRKCAKELRKCAKGENEKRMIEEKR
jgi:hypothetical protein